MGCVFDHEHSPKVVQDGPKVFPDRSRIDPKRIKKLENLVRDRAQNDLRLTPELPQDAAEPPTDHQNM